MMDDTDETRDTQEAYTPDFDNWTPPEGRIDPARVEVYTRMLRVDPTLATRYRQKNGE